MVALQRPIRRIKKCKNGLLNIFSDSRSSLEILIDPKTYQHLAHEAGRQGGFVQYLFRVKLKDSPYCARDSSKILYVLHVLEECDMFLRWRATLIAELHVRVGSSKESSPKTNSEYVQRLRITSSLNATPAVARARRGGAAASGAHVSTLIHTGYYGRVDAPRSNKARSLTLTTVEFLRWRKDCRSLQTGATPSSGHRPPINGDLNRIVNALSERPSRTTTSSSWSPLVNFSSSAVTSFICSVGYHFSIQLTGSIPENKDLLAGVSATKKLLKPTNIVFIYYESPRRSKKIEVYLVLHKPLASPARDTTARPIKTDRGSKVVSNLRHDAEISGCPPDARAGRGAARATAPTTCC
ncbi:hypothetical protein EVAR_36554_1 [Eumeta japonica]|uniref:Uncharacterized protein n=1 Tax=Eumeta variegata TaxID=151549 RepID=A0A4C1Y1W6_EUMVA|nr:hypothetical protein EVAR_36554_1 [Eumeta japonica]